MDDVDGLRRREVSVLLRVEAAQPVHGAFSSSGPRLAGLYWKNSPRPQRRAQNSKKSP